MFRAYLVTIPGRFFRRPRPDQAQETRISIYDVLRRMGKVAQRRAHHRTENRLEDGRGAGRLCPSHTRLNLPRSLEGRFPGSPNDRNPRRGIPHGLSPGRAEA
uniref:Uncharacterized protein n=1 Tax=Candidatus Kentrum sp. TUN TaxID=2126343 RepID=A0A451A792_9GAMM|nr:MAG: hypothetical protein BECKTUN1418D_GA0071000_11626 [Candidatus Kentron sp. TUN]